MVAGYEAVYRSALASAGPLVNHAPLERVAEPA
jgi:hypothetical protein